MSIEILNTHGGVVQMKRYAKIIALCLVTVFALFAFAACGAPVQSSEPAASTDTSSSEISEQPSETAEAQPSESTSAELEAQIDAIKAAGELVMLTNAAFPPFEYLGDDNKPAGVDIDIAGKIAEALGVTLRVDDMDFDGLIAALTAGKGDIAVAGMTVTEERMQSVDFSVKYITSSQYMIVAADEEGINTPADLAGKIIGVQEGTTGDFYASDEYFSEEDIAAGDGIVVNAGKVERYKTAIDAGMALLNGKIDVVIVDEMPARSIVASNPDALKIIENKLTEEQYAIALRKNSDLTPFVNELLEKMLADGTIDEFIIKHTS